jgi:hypothetical protein
MSKEDLSLRLFSLIISLVGVTVCVMSRRCCSRNTKPVYRNNVMVSLCCSILKGGSLSYNVANSLGIEFFPSLQQVLAQLLLDLDEAVATVTARSDGRMESSLRCAWH